MKSSPTLATNKPGIRRGRLQISHQWYGRDKAIESLLDAFAQICRGAGRGHLVPGQSGAGKTALVRLCARRLNGTALSWNQITTRQLSSAPTNTHKTFLQYGYRMRGGALVPLFWDATLRPAP